MKKIYYLKSCDTCRRIIRDLELDDSFELQNIKEEPISKDQLLLLRSKVNSYQDLLNKQSRFYKSEELKKKVLSEEQIKNYLLQEYTLLKRPIFLFDDATFIGNSKKNIDSLKEFIKTLK